MTTATPIPTPVPHAFPTKPSLADVDVFGLLERGGPTLGVLEKLQPLGGRDPRVARLMDVRIVVNELGEASLHQAS